MKLLLTSTLIILCNFTSLNGQSTSFDCGSQCPPVLASTKKEFQRKNKKATNIDAVVPVVFHVISDLWSGREFFSHENATLAIEKLNSDFSINESDDFKIKFALADYDENGIRFRGITRTRDLATYQALEHSKLLEEIAFSREEYVNVFIVSHLNKENQSGMATFPYVDQKFPEGILMARYAMPGFDKGFSEILTHEVGHYFGLQHVWGNGSCKGDDFEIVSENLGENYFCDCDGEQGIPADDTLPCNKKTTDCVNYENECESNFTNNFMDYVSNKTGECYAEFSKGQRCIMKSVLSNIDYGRKSLLDNAGDKFCVDQAYNPPLFHAEEKTFYIAAHKYGPFAERQTIDLGKNYPLKRSFVKETALIPGIDYTTSQNIKAEDLSVFYKKDRLGRGLLEIEYKNNVSSRADFQFFFELLMAMKVPIPNAKTNFEVRHQDLCWIDHYNFEDTTDPKRVQTFSIPINGVEIPFELTYKPNLGIYSLKEKSAIFKAEYLLCNPENHFFRAKENLSLQQSGIEDELFLEPTDFREKKEAYAYLGMRLGNGIGEDHLAWIKLSVNRAHPFAIRVLEAAVSLNPNEAFRVGQSNCDCACQIDLVPNALDFKEDPSNKGTYLPIRIDVHADECAQDFLSDFRIDPKDVLSDHPAEFEISHNLEDGFFEIKMEPGAADLSQNVNHTLEIIFKREGLNIKDNYCFNADLKFGFSAYEAGMTCTQINRRLTEQVNFGFHEDFENRDLPWHLLQLKKAANGNMNLRQLSSFQVSLLGEELLSAGDQISLYDAELSSLERAQVIMNTNGRSLKGRIWHIPLVLHVQDGDLRIAYIRMTEDCNGEIQILDVAMSNNPYQTELTCRDTLATCLPQMLNYLDCDCQDLRQDLIGFYIAMGGRDWIESWDMSESIKDWQGLKFKACELKGIELPYNNLVGKMPTLKFPDLELLNLSNNSITGKLPNFRTAIKIKYLDLSNNEFSGNISGLKNLEHLEYLDLSHNAIYNLVPDFRYQEQLYHVELNDNKFIGEIPEMENCKQLEHLDLSTNDLRGKLPLFPDKEELKVFKVADNHLEGCYPDSYFERLEDYDFSNNGELPSQGGSQNLGYQQAVSGADQYGMPCEGAKVIDENCDCSENFNEGSMALRKVGDLNVRAEGVMVFPNPFKKDLQISFESRINAHCELKIIDALGRTVYENQWSSKTAEREGYNLSLDVESGLYFYSLKVGEKSYEGKLMKY